MDNRRAFLKQLGLGVAALGIAPIGVSQTGQATARIAAAGATAEIKACRFSYQMAVLIDLSGKFSGISMPYSSKDRLRRIREKYSVECINKVVSDPNSLSPAWVNVQVEDVRCIYPPDQFRVGIQNASNDLKNILTLPDAEFEAALEKRYGPTLEKPTQSQSTLEQEIEKTGNAIIFLISEVKTHDIAAKLMRQQNAVYLKLPDRRDMEESSPLLDDVNRDMMFDVLRLACKDISPASAIYKYDSYLRIDNPSQELTDLVGTVQMMREKKSDRQSVR